MAKKRSSTRPSEPDLQDLSLVPFVPQQAVALPALTHENTDILETNPYDPEHPWGWGYRHRARQDGV